MSEVTVQLEIITPEGARELLKNQIHSRHIKPKHVEKLADDMQHDRWILNGEAIKISRDNQIVDGLHRLFACIQADVPFTTIVIRGIDPDITTIVNY